MEPAKALPKQAGKAPKKPAATAMDAGVGDDPRPEVGMKSGRQTGQHPAKDQPNVMRYLR